MDDGQVFLDPALVSSFLETLDAELSRVGASRGEGADVKSVAKLVGSESAIAELGDGWITSHVRRTCKLPMANAPSLAVLGIDVGSADVRNAQFREACSAVRTTREAIASIGDSAVELILTRMCADVCKITHLLRAHGDSLNASNLQDYDKDLDSALASALAGPLHSEALDQASLGVRDGGLAARRAADTVTSAFLASRVRARPLVMRIAETLRDSELLPEGFSAAYDHKVSLAATCIRQCLSPAAAMRFDDLLSDWTTKATDEVDAILGQQRPNHQRSGCMYAGLGEALVQPAGGEDPEWETERGGLQHELSRLLDAEKAAQLESRLGGQSRWSDVRRLRELRDPSTSHDWLWSLNPVHGAIVPSDEFSTAVRIRLGAFLTDEPTLWHVYLGQDRCAQPLLCGPARHSRSLRSQGQCSPSCAPRRHQCFHRNT